MWQGVEYKGTHEPLISSQLFDQVQGVFAGRNKPKHRKHAFAFAGLLKCAHDGCTVTTEKQKRKYVIIAARRDGASVHSPICASSRCQIGWEMC